MIYVGCFLTIVLWSIALLHIYWGHGGVWPGKDRKDLTRRVAGLSDRFPPMGACYVVATLLFISGILPLAKVGVIDVARELHPELDLGLSVLILVFAMRGIGGYFYFRENKWGPVFVRLNKIYYGPLCVLITLLFVSVLS